MATQRHDGGQINENLAIRSVVDWNLPDLLKLDSAVKRIAELHLKGCHDRNLPLKKLKNLHVQQNILVKVLFFHLAFKLMPGMINLHINFV